MDMAAIGYFVGGLVLLVGGATWLVRGASALAAAAGISPLVIGLTVVAFGTSAPELGVSVMAAVSGESDLAIGNVVGSNISNILLILGMAACVAPLVVSAQVIRREVPIMIALSVVVLLMSLDGVIGRLDGMILVAALLTYIISSIRDSRRDSQAALAAGEAVPVPPGDTRALVLEGGRLVAGLALLLLGTTGVVRGAVAIAEAAGVSSLLIGLTVVAVGTSLPEAATSIVAAMKGERDLAVGNAVGSNIFNLLAILGVTSLVQPIGIPVEVLQFDLPMMIAVAVACLPVFFTGGRLNRWEGAVFVGYYVAYTVYLVLDATNHDAYPTYRTMMLLFVAPLTGLTFMVLAVRAWRR
jgi:cation:H+ antiporter